ncbi:MAG: hypothetical protein MJZ86_02750 [Bacteroidales bacterium]|nr:hypothetical protein [Bacteroidales bacterium]
MKKIGHNGRCFCFFFFETKSSCHQYPRTAHPIRTFAVKHRSPRHHITSRSFGDSIVPSKTAFVSIGGITVVSHQIPYPSHMFPFLIVLLVLRVEGFLTKWSGFDAMLHWG